MPSTNKKLISYCFVFFWVFLIISILLSIVINTHKKIRKMEREERSAIVHAEYARLNALRQACRQRWEGKDRVPIIGGGWVDVKKIPYEFINMQENDDGECGAVGIMESVFYWDGENIIPHHEAFSGVSLGTFSHRFTTYIPIYTPKEWVHFAVTATFRNQHEAAVCKEKGEGYVNTIWGGCLKKCKWRDGAYVIDKIGRCVINKEAFSLNPPLSKIVQSNVYRDLVMLIDREDYPHFTTYGRTFLFKEWPYKEPPPFIDVGGVEFSQRTFNLTREQLGSMNIEKIKFAFYDIGSKDENFYFQGGKAMARTGKMSLHDAFPFSKKLYEYLSNVVIKENE